MSRRLWSDWRMKIQIQPGGDHTAEITLPEELTVLVRALTAALFKYAKGDKQ